MRMGKFLSLVFIITSFALMYVWQQTQIYCLAYSGQKDLTKFQNLLDENSLLRYNLKRNTSLIRIGTKVWESSDFQMPENYCLVKLNYRNEELKLAEVSAIKQESLFSKLFSIKREAEAKTIQK